MQVGNEISRAHIVNGRWRRNVPWQSNGVWRTDMFKSVLADPRLKEAEFICRGGPRIVIPVEDLRAVLPLLHDHYGSRIWGPFNIEPITSTIDGHSVSMVVEWPPEC